MLRLFAKMAVSFFVVALFGGCTSFDLNWLQSREDGMAARAEKVRTDAEFLLSREEPLAALDLIIEQEAGPGLFARTYVTAYNLLLDQAQAYYMEGDLVAAGEFWRQALNRYPTDVNLQDAIIMNEIDLGQRLDRCAARLLEAGLAAYRNGQLQEAIDVWSQIRNFHPDYKASQQAIQTTRKQLKSLELLHNPG